MRFFVETYGCTMNQGESQDLAHELSLLGHEHVEGEEEAELVLVNTCVVIRPTELKIMRRLRHLAQSGKEMVITGCIPSVQRKVLAEEFPEAILFSPDEYPSFPQRIRERYGSSQVAIIEDTPLVTGILPISQGCLGSCTYCLTKKARGHLKSYPWEQIKSKASILLNNGARELLVTAQDTGCYGLDIDGDLGQLIERLSSLSGDFMIRVGMMNPDSLELVLEPVVAAWSGDKVYKFLHLPVQSGSETVLAAMGRGYTPHTFEAQVERFRSVHPLASISTDIITGFPGESENDHRRSMELIERIRPSTVNVTRFSPRPGTPAAKAKNQVPGWVAKERSREMTQLRFELAEHHYSQFVGRSVMILVTEKGKGETLIGRTKEYCPIVVPGHRFQIGNWYEVEVVGGTATHLLGR